LLPPQDEDGHALMELETKLADDVLVVATAPFMHNGPAVVLDATEWAPPAL
jgi:hypothetical protein